MLMASKSTASTTLNTITATNPTSTTTTPVKLPVVTAYDSTTTNTTTFVQADPSNFRAIVQHLTGAPIHPPPAQKPPYSFPSPKLTLKPNPSDMAGIPPPAFKLHERRQAMRKLEMIELNNNSHGSSSSSMVMPSPVSPLDNLARGIISPSTPRSPFEEEEERAIANKGFYLHPVSPLSNTTTPRDAEPRLLPLFPLHSPARDDNY
ncbi:hypothetical protein Ancab_012065 [Ancistrocladus abbreviatus]